jgi:hypothetical protein
LNYNLESFEMVNIFAKGKNKIAAEDHSDNEKRKNGFEEEKMNLEIERDSSEISFLSLVSSKSTN